MEVSLLAGMNVWFVLVLLVVLPFEQRPFPWLFKFQIVDAIPAQTSGLLLIATGFALFVLSLQALDTSWRLGVDAQNPGPLVTDGVYAFSRNPIYVFFDFYFIGTFLMNGHLIFLVFALLAVANLHYQIVQEEKSLAQTHGHPYERYRSQVGRYASCRRWTGRKERLLRRQASD
jgi:protein-S-isoprenylcysteine O-methyltransferase Ste14